MKKYVNDALAARVDTIVARHGARARQDVRKARADAGYRFVNKDDSADLFLYGEISEWWGISANDFVHDLNETDAKTIELYINSPGGSVFSGFAIYSALVRHSEKNGVTINVVIDGIAASIASVIAMAGDNIKIAEHASTMIHQPWGWAMGTADDMREEADVLEDLEETIVDIYVARTGGDRDQIAQWVKDETWMKGKVAVDRGFADEVIALKTKKKDDEEDRARVASVDVDYLASLFPNMPDDVREALTRQPAVSSEDKTPPKTTRELARALRDIGFSRDAADSIAAHGFKQKDKPRDAAPTLEEPTTTDPRDGAAERDEALAVIRRAAAAAAIRAV